MKIVEGDRLRLYEQVELEVVAVRRDVVTLVLCDPKTLVPRDTFFHDNLVAYRQSIIEDKVALGDWSILKSEGVTV